MIPPATETVSKIKTIESNTTIRIVADCRRNRLLEAILHVNAELGSYFQVAFGRCIKDHVVADICRDDAPNMNQVGLLRLLEIIHDCACSNYPDPHFFRQAEGH